MNQTVTVSCDILERMVSNFRSEIRIASNGMLTDKAAECLRLAELKAIELSILLRDARAWELSG